MTAEPQIATFYSYKGGTGRTMALANVAWILASNGKRVLAVDWDLEAPGLHRYFHPFLLDKECQSSPGVIDMVWDVSVSAMKLRKPDSDPNWYRQYSDVLKYAVSLQWTFPNGGRLDLLPAGRQSGAYAVRVNSFDWKNFYERIGGGGFLKAVRESMRNEYQYVLIDSRTGVSDTSGICTVELPDTLVVCFTLNTQSIEGSAAVTRSVVNEHQRRGRSLRIFPVPMRLEDGEKKKLDAGLDYAREHFESFASVPPGEFDTYWGGVAVPYKRFYAYEEVLAPFADRAKQTQALLPTAEKLTSYLTDNAVTAVPPIVEAERRRWLSEFERGSGDEPPLEQGLAALQAGDLDLAKQHLLRAMNEAEASGDQELLASARHQLSAVARSQGDLQSAEKWFRQAVGQAPDEPSSEATDLLQLRTEDVAQRWESYLKHNAWDAIINQRDIYDEAIPLAKDAVRLIEEADSSTLRPSVRFEIDRTLRKITPQALMKPTRRAISFTAGSLALNIILAPIFGYLTYHPQSWIAYNLGLPLTITFGAIAFFSLIGLEFALLGNMRLRRRIGEIFKEEKAAISSS
jgi:MinD-like ATPase involved in chromosome partitioning or flagellar assembly